MKRCASILILTILVVALLPLALVMAGPIHTPHEDPDAAESGLDMGLAILLHYADVLSLLAQGNYQDAKDMVEQLDLEQASIPDDIKSVMQTYNGLLSDLSGKLDSLDAVLDEAELLLEQGEVEQARLRLTAAGELIDEARVLLADIDEATGEITRLLGPLVSSAEVEAVDEAGARLQEAMQRLGELEALYEASLQSLETELARQEVASPTYITLGVDKSQAWVGDSLTASGTLTFAGEEGGPLPNRKIIIVLNKEAEVAATTDDSGQYQTSVNIAYLHVPRLTLEASYVPEGEDMGEYSSSSSLPVEIEVSLYPTELTLTLDGTNPWAGDTITASGALTSPDEGGAALPGRDIHILLGGVVMDTVTTQADGSYEGTVVIPYEYITLRGIRARYAYAGDKYAPASSPVKPIEVQFYSTELTLTLDGTNPWVGDTITASGALTSPDEGGRALPGRDIHILLDGVVMDTVTTQADGSYEGTVMIPYEYITLRRIQARYAYAGDKYAPALSPVKPIKVQFYSTELTLNVSSTEAWVGDTISASGALISPDEGGTALPGRDIDILLDGMAVTKVTTQPDGSYQGTVDISGEYVTSRTVQARYVPLGEDEGRYHPCSSDSVEVSILFHQAEFQMDVPEQAYPGLPLKIGGEITYEGEVVPVQTMVQIFLDGELLRSFNCSGTFDLEVIPYPQTVAVRPYLQPLEGEHTLRVVVESEGRYRGISAKKTFTIIKGLPEIEVQSTSFITPPKKVRVKGRLYSELPLQMSLVEIELRGTSKLVSISADGEFEVIFNLPLDSFVMGSQEVTIKAEPFEAWHLSSETTTDVFVVDVVNLGLVSVAFVSIGVVLYTRRRGKPGRREAEVLEASLPLPEPTEIALRELHELKDSRGRILKAYAEAAGVVEKATKVSVKPNMTLREFLREIMPELDGAAEAFVELTHLSERALYSPYTLGEDEAMQAESLVLTVKEKLGSGIA